MGDLDPQQALSIGRHASVLFSSAIVRVAKRPEIPFRYPFIFRLV